MTEIHELDLTGWSYGGEALGRSEDGRVVFVAFAAAGERVRVELTEQHRRWARGRLLEVLEPTEERIEARCPHFAHCGGCHYQHMPYSRQLEIKADILAEQLERIGGFDDPPVEPTIPSPEPWNYRNRLRFHLTETGELGFHTWSDQRVFPLEVCHLAEETVARLWPQLQLEAAESLRAVEVRADTHGTPMVILHGIGEADLTVDLDLPGSVIWLSESGPTVLAGDPYGWMVVQGMRFRVSPGAFFQTNTPLLERLVEEVIAAADPRSPQVAYDLYAGVGLFSAFLADGGAAVIAVEESPLAGADLEVNLEPFQGVEFYEAPVEQALPAIPRDPDLVVVDPPRAGLGRDVVFGILDRQPRRLVYLSCDPATMARDAQQLAQGGFLLQRAVPIDLFPQTYHIESLTVWEHE